jgi:anti-anti-sigma factor
MDDIVKIEKKAKGKVAVVGFESACVSDADSITAMSKRIKKFINDQRPIGLVFDFSGVKFFSSQVLGLLLDIRTAITAAGGQIVISAIDPQLHRVFKITSLDKIFTFFQDQDSAVKSFSQAPSKTQEDQ